MTKRAIGMLLVIAFSVTFIASIAYAGAIVPKEPPPPPPEEEEVAPPPPPPPPPPEPEEEVEEEQPGCFLWPF